MATVTAYTAEHMDALMAEDIVDGVVNGAGHLILTKRDLSTFDAGSVIGPTGLTGLTGPTSIAVVTNATRPTGGARFTGLAIYETDTKNFYIWDGTNWLFFGKTFICTSATRPTATHTGLEIFETDTGRKLIWNGTAWIPVGPRGELFSYLNGSDFLGITSTPATWSTTSSLVIPSNRIIDMKFVGTFYKGPADANAIAVTLMMVDGVNVNQRHNSLSTSESRVHAHEHSAHVSAGSHTFAVQIYNSTSLMNIQSNSSFIVEDKGAW